MKQLLRRGWNSFRRWMRDPRILYRAETPQLTTTIEVRSWLPWFVFAITLFLYLSDPTPVVLMTLVALGGLLVCGFLWARTMARTVRGERHLRFAAMQVGDELEEQVGLSNDSSLPVIWAEFLDRSNIPGYTVSSARAVESRAEAAWRAHTIAARRGVFTLGPWELRIGEPFGFFKVRQLYLDRQEILVYPPLAALPEHVLPHRGAVGDHRPLNQPLQAETIASTTVRAYVPGDPLRHIHWPTTARRASPFVKTFAPEAASSIWLVPDFDMDVQVGTGDTDSQETMVTVVASLAAALLQQNLSVGMFASADQEKVVLPRQGQPHLWTVLQALAPLRAAPGSSLKHVLDRVQALVRGNDLLIVVTPSLNPDWIGPLRRISRSRGSGGRAEVVLLDPASFDHQPQNEPATGAEEFLTVLISHGITANILRREDVRVISGYYGEVSRWEFTVTGTGRAAAKRTPRAVERIAENARFGPWYTPES